MALGNHSRLNMNFWALSPHPGTSHLSIGCKSVQHDSVWVPVAFWLGHCYSKESSAPLSTENQGNKQDSRAVISEERSITPGVRHASPCAAGVCPSSEPGLLIPLPGMPSHVLNTPVPSHVSIQGPAMTCDNSRMVVTRGLGNWGMLSQGTNLQLVDK